MVQRMINEQMLRLVAIKEAQSILDSLTGVVGVVIATADGFELTSVSHSSATSPARVAAMASSISAIGMAVAAEAGLGRSRAITINTETGFAHMATAYRSDVTLVVNVIGGPRAVLAQASYRCAQCVRALEAV